MIVTCSYCGTDVDVFREPMVEQVHEADTYSPKVFIITGGGWLMHRCIIEADEAS